MKAFYQLLAATVIMYSIVDIIRHRFSGKIGPSFIVLEDKIIRVSISFKCRYRLCNTALVLIISHVYFGLRTPILLKIGNLLFQTAKALSTTAAAFVS